MNSKFPVLSSLATVIRVLGWLTSFGGALWILIAVQEGKTTPVMALGAGVVILGLLVVAFGESIGVVFAIEENTRRAGGQASEAPSAGVASPVKAVTPAKNEGLRLQDVPPEMLERFKAKAGQDAITFSMREGNRWLCVCGTTNVWTESSRNEPCTNCDRLGERSVVAFARASFT